MRFLLLVAGALMTFFGAFALTSDFAPNRQVGSAVFVGGVICLAIGFATIDIVQALTKNRVARQSPAEQVAAADRPRDTRRSES
jgi:hypothetical protein